MSARGGEKTGLCGTPASATSGRLEAAGAGCQWNRGRAVRLLAIALNSEHPERWAAVPIISGSGSREGGWHAVDLADPFASIVGRVVSEVAVQPRLGLLPEW